MISVAPATAVPHFEPDLPSPKQSRFGFAQAGRERDGDTAEFAGLDFWDLVDVINPLQHIPILSSFYRALTGDTIKPAMRVLGGALFGGPVGLLTAFASGAVEQASGRDPGDILLAFLRGEASPAQAPEALPPEALPQLASGPPLSLLPSPRSAAPAVAGVPAPAGPPPWLRVALAQAETPSPHKSSTRPARSL